jgi:heme A synthase
VIAQDTHAFERLAQLLVLAMFLNIASGAFVRLTGSGLGCPDWPLCKGQPVPPFNYHPVIEFSNRAIALAGILAALLTYLSARRVADRMARRLAGGVALLTLGQIPLGAVTVLLISTRCS